MQSADALQNLSARGRETHLAAREGIAKALLGPGDTWTRQRMAQAAWDRANATLATLQAQCRAAAHEAAQGHRRDLFDLTRRAAHSHGDPLALTTAKDSAQRAARKVNGQTEAVGIVSAALQRPGAGDGFHLVVAGAVAERAHDERWTEAATIWATSSIGVQRGGLTRLAALEHAERVAAGDALPDGLADLQPLLEQVAFMRFKWVEPDAEGA